MLMWLARHQRPAARRDALVGSTAVASHRHTHLQCCQAPNSVAERLHIEFCFSREADTVLQPHFYFLSQRCHLSQPQGSNGLNRSSVVRTAHSHSAHPHRPSNTGSAHSAKHAQEHKADTAPESITCCLVTCAAAGRAGTALSPPSCSLHSGQGVEPGWGSSAKAARMLARCLPSSMGRLSSAASTRAAGAGQARGEAWRVAMLCEQDQALGRLGFRC